MEFLFINVGLEPGVSVWGCFCKMYAFEEHRFSSRFMGFLVGLYITIHPHIFFFISQSHTFAAENCAIGNIVK